MRHQPQVVGVGVRRGRDVAADRVGRIGAEDHRLQVEAAARRQDSGDVGEQVPVDPLLPAGLVIRRRAEVLEGSEARHRVEWAEAVAVDLAGVAQVGVEAVPAAGFELRGREGHPRPPPTPLAGEVEHRPPPAPEVEHRPIGPDPDLLGDVGVLAALGLLEGQREVAVELRAAEVGELAEAEPEDPIDQRVGEVEILAIGHGAYSRSGAFSLDSARLGSDGVHRSILCRTRATRFVPRVTTAVAKPPERSGFIPRRRTASATARPRDTARRCCSMNGVWGVLPV